MSTGGFQQQIPFLGQETENKNQNAWSNFTVVKDTAQCHQLILFLSTSS